MCLLDIFNFLTLWTLRYINCTLSDLWHKSHLFSVSLIWQEITNTKVLTIKLAFLKPESFDQISKLFHGHCLPHPWIECKTNFKTDYEDSYVHTTLTIVVLLYFQTKKFGRQVLSDRTKSGLIISNTVLTKGQLNSEWIHEHIDFPK